MISYHLQEINYAAPPPRSGYKASDVNDPTRISTAARKFIWSPIIWTTGTRSQANFERVDWCVLDFDSGELTLADARRAFCDIQGFIGTTKSHQAPKKDAVACDRFRVALRFERPITDLRTYRYQMHRIMKRYPCDRSCKDGARIFYPCREIVEIWSGDDYGLVEVMTPDDVPGDFDRPKLYRAHRTNGLIPPWASHQLSIVIPVGDRNSTIYRLAKDLFKVGFDQDEIVERIIGSPTYDPVVVTAGLREEILTAVRSGIKKAEEEMGHE